MVIGTMIEAESFLRERGETASENLEAENIQNVNLKEGYVCTSRCAEGPNTGVYKIFNND